MYHRIVTNSLLGAFAGLNRGDISAVTDKFAPDAEHYFVGHHALAGTRHTPQSIREWYERLLRLLPDINFKIRRIQVQGPPWHTLATVEWRETNSGNDGIVTSAEGVNVIEIRWGKVTRVAIYTDTSALERTLNRNFGVGTLEAHAPPIEDSRRFL